MAISIDADALFRAVTATGYKLLAYHLSLDTGEITSRTLKPGEVAAAPQGPSVKPLPKMGGDLTPKKDVPLFGPEPPAAPKKKLFDDDGPRKPAAAGDFFKRDEKKKANPFGDGGFKRESGAKKLAELFAGRDPSPAEQLKPAPSIADASQNIADDPRWPRIPAASDEVISTWMYEFAKDFGDPEIRDEMGAAIKSAKPQAAWERLFRKHVRAGQQWERYYRKQALYWAEAWLSDLGISWELIEETENS